MAFCVPSTVLQMLRAESVTPWVFQGFLKGAAAQCEVVRVEDLRQEQTQDQIQRKLVYDVMRTDTSRILFKAEHLERMQTSYQRATGASLTEMKAALADSLEQYMMNSSVQAAQIPTPCNLKWITWVPNDEEGLPFLVFYMKSFFPPAQWYQKGVRLALLYNAAREAPNEKVVQAILRERAVRLQCDLEAYETLLVNPQEKEFLIPEGSKSNYLLLTKDSRFLSSEKCDILVGITLQSVMSAVKHAGLGAVTFQRLHLKDLLEAQSVIVLGTSPGTLPAREIVLYYNAESRQAFELAVAHSGIKLTDYDHQLLRCGEEAVMNKQVHNSYLEKLLQAYQELSLRSYQ